MIFTNTLNKKTAHNWQVNVFAVLRINNKRLVKQEPSFFFPSDPSNKLFYHFFIVYILALTEPLIRPN